MRNAFRRVTSRASLAAGLTGLALLAAPNLASAADETFAYAGASVVPGQPLVSFDISWVDRKLNEYFLADRSNKGVDIFPIEAGAPVFQIIPTGVNAFAGFTGNNGTSGPDGLLTLNDVNNNEGFQLWVGDGPTANPQCPASIPMCSTVKIFNGASGENPAHTVPTNGVARSDELCWVPGAFTKDGNGYIVIANESEPTTQFLSFIPTAGPSAYRVVKIFPVTEATDGIEQCKWDPIGNTVYVNVPEVNGPGDNSNPGEILVFNGFDMSFRGRSGVDHGACAGPQGMAIGSRVTFQDGAFVGTAGNMLAPATPPLTNILSDRILLGCVSKSSGPFGFSLLEIHAPVGAPLTALDAVIYPNLGGADEVWFDETAAQHYASASSKNPVANLLPIIDHNNIGDVDSIITTGFSGNSGRNTHSVAGWSGNAPGAGNLTAFFVPIPAVGGGTAPFSSAACTTAAAIGCIAYFITAPIPTGPFPENADIP